MVWKRLDNQSNYDKAFTTLRQSLSTFSLVPTLLSSCRFSKVCQTTGAWTKEQEGEAAVDLGRVDYPCTPPPLPRGVVTVTTKQNSVAVPFTISKTKSMISIFSQKRTPHLRKKKETIRKKKEFRLLLHRIMIRVTEENMRRIQTEKKSKGVVVENRFPPSKLQVGNASSRKA